MKQRPEHEAPASKEGLLVYLQAEYGDDLKISQQDMQFIGCGPPERGSGYAWYWSFEFNGVKRYAYISLRPDGEFVFDTASKPPAG